MKSLRSLTLCAFVLSLAPSFALADEPPPAQWAQRRVEEGVVKPLQKQDDERSTMSRVRRPPHERRVRVTDKAVTYDKSGAAFMAFAVDVKYGDKWKQGDVVGCVYKESGNLYIKKGDAYRPLAFLLGQNVPPIPGVCTAGKEPARS